MTDKTIDVLGIGNAIVDVLAQCPEEQLAAFGAEKGSMRLIDEAQAKEIYAQMGPGQETSGGSAANTIAGIASLGGNTGFIGRVKDDQLGGIFAHDIRAIGAQYQTAMADNGPATAQCLILITPDGERTMNTYLGASVELTVDDIDEGIIAGSNIVYLEGYLWDPPEAKKAFEKAARIAKQHGCKVALTLSDAFCVERHRDSFVEFIRNGVDLLFANEAEITSLYQINDIEVAAETVKNDCAMAVLTRSGEGCLVVHEGTTQAFPAQPVPQVVDSTGAGDLFAAGFMFGLSRQKSLSECARIGAMAAAEIISQIGARPQRALAELI